MSQVPPAELDRIMASAPESLAQWQEAVVQLPAPRPEMRRWLDLFDAAAANCGYPNPGTVS